MEAFANWLHLVVGILCMERSMDGALPLSTNQLYAQREEEAIFNYLREFGWSWQTIDRHMDAWADTDWQGVA